MASRQNNYEKYQFMKEYLSDNDIISAMFDWFSSDELDDFFDDVMLQNDLDDFIWRNKK